MNTDRKTAASADLAYLRELAEAGVNAPLLGGRFMAWWGGLTGAAMATHWAVIAGHIAISADQLWLFWLSYIVVGSAGSALLGWSLRNKPGTGSMGNRVQSVIWPTMGGCIGTYFLGLAIGILSGQVDLIFINTILPVAFLCYGAAGMVTAVLGRQKLLFLSPVVSLAACLASTIMVMTAEVYLVAAAAMLLGTFLPGLLMMQQEPRDVV